MNYRQKLKFTETDLSDDRFIDSNNYISIDSREDIPMEESDNDDTPNLK